MVTHPWLSTKTSWWTTQVLRGWNWSFWGINPCLLGKASRLPVWKYMEAVFALGWTWDDGLLDLMKNDNAEVIWISSNVHVICEMGQVLKLWHPDFPHRKHQHILTMANHAAFLQRYWPISNGHRYRRPQRRHHSGQLKDPHRGDVHQRLLVSKNSGRSQVALKWCWNFFVNFEWLHFSFFLKNLHVASKSWKKVGNLDVEAVQRPFNVTKLRGAWEIPSARRRVEATRFDLGVPAESGRLIGWFSDPLLNCNIYIYIL